MKASTKLYQKLQKQYSRRINLDLKRIKKVLEKLNNPEEGVSGGIKYKQVERLTPSIIAQGHEGKKETIYLEPEVDINTKRVTGPFTVEAVPSIRVKNPN